MEYEKSDILTERAAQAFHKHLRRCYPDTTWVRVRKDKDGKTVPFDQATPAKGTLNDDSAK